MKKIVFVLTVMLSVSLMFTSCKESKKGEMNNESHEGHDHDNSNGDTSKEVVYQCPMDCEKGKTYAKKGSCPVCKMDLKAKSSKKGAKQAENVKCKNGAECKSESGKRGCQKETACANCEPGKCKSENGSASIKCESGKRQCQNETACTKCEPGECTCKKEVAKMQKECSHCEPGSCECKA